MSQDISWGVLCPNSAKKKSEGSDPNCRLEIVIRYAKRCLSVNLNQLKTILTRKSSCVNARGIPTAAYQVLLEMGYPPPQPGLTGGGGGTRGGVPPSQVWQEKGGTIVGYPLARSNWGGYPRWGTPQPGLMGGTRGGVPPARSDGGEGGIWGGVPPPSWTWQGYPLPRLDLAGVGKYLAITESEATNPL